MRQLLFNFILLINVFHNSQPVTESAEEIARYIQERKRRFPTNANLKQNALDHITTSAKADAVADTIAEKQNEEDSDDDEEIPCEKSIDSSVIVHEQSKKRPRSFEKKKNKSIQSTSRSDLYSMVNYLSIFSQFKFFCLFFILKPVFFFLAYCARYPKRADHSPSMYSILDRSFFS